MPASFFAQSDAAQWQFACAPRGDGAAVFEASATIKTGWHLYSQHLVGGGPIPTRFKFIHSQDFSLSEGTKEYGDKVQFHDDLYDMEIIWYSAHVKFEQVIVPHSYPVSVRGTIEYMTCDEHTCIPSKKEFEVAVRQP